MLFRSSTGVYTAPSAGMYEFTISINDAAPGSGVIDRMRVVCSNGGSFGSVVLYDNNSLGVTAWALTTCFELDLDASDTVSVTVQGDTSTGSNWTIARYQFTGRRLYDNT